MSLCFIIEVVISSWRQYTMWQKKDEYQLQRSVSCDVNHREGYGIMDTRNGNLCIGVWAALSAGPSVGIRLFSGGAQATVQLKWGQTRERSLSSSWITHKPLIPAACTEVSAPCSLSRGPGSRDAPSSAYHNPFSKHSTETFFPLLLIAVSLTSSLFFPLLSLQGLARLLAWLEGVEKKGFKTHWHASPKSIFGECSFFFLSKQKKSHREK